MPASPIDGVLFKKEVDDYKIGIGKGIKTIDVYARGLTKREAFAMAAMQGLLASDSQATYEDFSCLAVGMADALLAELEK